MHLRFGHAEVFEVALQAGEPHLGSVGECSSLHRQRSARRVRRAEEHRKTHGDSGLPDPIQPQVQLRLT